MLSLQLGKGLSWSTESKQISIIVRNMDVDFITESKSLTYKFYVVWDYGQAQTIREGTVNAVMVA